MLPRQRFKLTSLTFRVIKFGGELETKGAENLFDTRFSKDTYSNETVLKVILKEELVSDNVCH